jgi:hypothetical protein
MMDIYIPLSSDLVYDNLNEVEIEIVKIIRNKL